ncbi:pathogenesis-related protein 1-like isoform X1 [Arachis stenosperma]|uniref:pathogenesis-related protein 1-like isoform X1 n=1 Tax=Arachis stenosperma TaxID=217475 RepID=UPI0025ACC843|nr:pathogenesis-related protein 1-like isoform X1 [Arachis stenosperma]
MEMPLKIWVVIISFISIVPLFLMAQNLPKDYLKAHNDARAEVKVKPLKWDLQLTLHARNFVKKHISDCKEGLHDATFVGNKYGQNSAYHPRSVSGQAHEASKATFSTIAMPSSTSSFSVDLTTPTIKTGSIV